jgi:hypothetical protein
MMKSTKRASRIEKAIKVGSVLLAGAWVGASPAIAVASPPEGTAMVATYTAGGLVSVVVVMFLLLLVTGGEELGGLIDAGSVLVQEPTVGMARCCLYGGGEGLVGECVGPADHLCVCVCV